MRTAATVTNATRTMPLDHSSLPLVTIVTPAYNEEKYLSQCVESVLAQTHSNWDYLILDNCSTDQTRAVAEKYASRDARIRVVSNSSLLPAVANFNHALRQISPRSKYCKIIFADDWMFPECLERMVGRMEENPSVGIVAAYGLQNDHVLWQGVPYQNSTVPGREICRQRLLGGPYVFGSPSSVLFRSDLVRSRDHFYNEANSHGADSEACFELLEGCDFGFVHQVLTFSSEREGSLLAASRKINASAGDLLRELVVYGPRYLTADEYKDRLDVALLKYYDFLASSSLHRRGDVFWDYHKRKLRDCGIDFNRLSIVRAFGRKVLNRFRLRSNGKWMGWGL